MRRQLNEGVMRTLRNLATLVFATVVVSASPSVTAGDEKEVEIVSKVDLSYLVNGRRPIWMGPVIRYTVHKPSNVEARISGLTGELILVLPLGVQQPGQYTLPWDGTADDGLATFDGKYQFELFFDDEYAAKFWFIAKSLQTFDEI